MRYLYAIFESVSPKYILDAGANAGFSTSLFKLLWPEVVVVSVEPDPSNFEALQLNTATFTGVHAVNAGLWGYKARIGQTGNHGEWGKIFAEKKWHESGGMPAYGVQDLAKMFNIPAFDFVKIDIEGAEGQVFSPNADISWVDEAKVISLEVHDYFAPYFGLQDVSSRIDAALSDRPFTIVSDNEHVMYLSKDVANSL
jgi:FkbM family methyltransferase